MNIDNLRKAFKKDFSFFMSVPALLWVALFFYFPLITIIGRSFLAADCTCWLPCIDITPYATFFDWTYVNIIKRSLLLALGTAVACLFIAYPVAYFLARRVKKWKNIFLFFIMLPFSVNLLIQAYSWFFVLGKTGLINSIAMHLGLISQPLHMLNTPMAVYIGMVYCYVPFMLLPLYTVLEKIDVRYIEASLDLGASWYDTLTRIIIPLSMPGIRTGFFLVFIPVFGEFVIPALLGGNKQMFVGTVISHYYLTMHNLTLGSAFTVLSSIVVLFVAFVIYRYLKLNRP